MSASPDDDVVLTASEMQRVRAFVDSNLSSKLTVATVAREIGVSEDHFSDMFREAFGMKLRDWLTRQRCWDAAARLIGSENSIPEIAEQLGFCGLSEFTRVFSRRFGVGPGAYRRNVRRYEQAKAALQPFQS